MAVMAEPNDVTFEPLPPPGVGGAALSGRVRSPWKLALMANPNEWALIPIAYNSAASVELRSPGFEIKARTVNGERCVYGRYVPEQAS